MGWKDWSKLTKAWIISEIIVVILIVFLLSLEGGQYGGQIVAFMLSAVLLVIPSLLLALLLSRKAKNIFKIKNKGASVLLSIVFIVIGTPLFSWIHLVIMIILISFLDLLKDI